MKRQKAIILYKYLLLSCIVIISCSKSPETLTFTKAVYIARVTGTPLDTDSFPSPNQTARDYNVGGTDLGIVWEMNKGEYGIFLGDTYGKHHFAEPILKESDWRCNVLAFSNDLNLADGLTINSMVVDSLKNASEIIYGAKDKSGAGDWTSIPTGAIRANNIDYVHYMNVKHWNTSNWGTNCSALYRSEDSGQTWKRSDKILFGEDSNFGQVGYWKKDGYVYMIGTESGRQSSARLARFKEESIEDQNLYEYWNKEKQKWVQGNENEATNLFVDTVGELSFIYHEKTKMWIISYFSEARYDISFRYAKNITGPWSEPQQLAHGSEHPQLYGSYIHPLSAKDDNIYFLMSLWQPYNVFLMKADILY